MSIETYFSYLVVVFIFFATPPDTSQLLIISNSLKHGLKKSVLTIAGDLTANALQMTAAAFGLVAALSVSGNFFQLIKWAGVVYLLYIGIRLLFSVDKNKQVKIDAKKERRSLFQQGFFTSAANPFAIAFFAALFPQFIDQNGNIGLQLLILGGTYLLVDGVILVLWGLCAIRLFAKFKSLSTHWLDRICGSFMILAAIYLSKNDMSGARGS